MYASDRGDPPSTADVDVELDVVDRNNKPPIWDRNIYGPIHIKENVTVGTVVTSIKARLVYSLIRVSYAIFLRSGPSTASGGGNTANASNDRSK